MIKQSLISLIFTFFILFPLALKTEDKLISGQIESDIVFAYIPLSVKKDFLSIQEVLEDNMLFENNETDSFYDMCTILEYDSKIIPYHTALAAVKDALSILEKSYDLFSCKEITKSSYQPIITALQEYKECLLQNESTITVGFDGIKIAQNLKITNDGSYTINLSHQDITQLLTLFRQKLYRAPRTNEDQELPPINSDFLDIVHLNTKSINTEKVNVCDELILNSLDLGMEIEDLISCCDAQDSRLDVVDSEIDVLESCCDAQGSRLDILESEVDIIFENCCDTQNSRLDIVDSEIDVLESCCDAHDSRLDILESENDLLESCCDAHDSRLDILASKIENIIINSIVDKVARSCCDFQASRIDVLESEVDILESCCDTQDSRLDVIDSRLDGLQDKLVFTPNDIVHPGTTSPDMTFDKVYGNNSKITLRVWIMKDSGDDPDPLSIQFKIPDDFNSNGLAIVDAHLLIDDLTGGSTDTARLRLRSDFKGNDEQLGNSVGGFADEVESSTFTVIEPTASEALNHLRVSMTITDSVVDTIEPNDWAFIVLDRSAPSSGTEYDNNIFLSTVSFQYQKK